jgi:hypothetical protein
MMHRGVVQEFAVDHSSPSKMDGVGYAYSEAIADSVLR